MSTMIQQQSRRLKRLEIPDWVALQAIVKLPSPMNTITVLRVEGLPDDAILLSVHYDFRIRLFAFTVSHHSFEEVGDGCEIPLLGGPLGIGLSWDCMYLGESSADRADKAAQVLVNCETYKNTEDEPPAEQPENQSMLTRSSPKK